MPISSSGATIEKRKYLRIQQQVKSVDQNDQQHTERNLLKIEPALPVKNRRSLYVRSHSTLNPSSLTKGCNDESFPDTVLLQTKPDGTVHISRTQKEKEKQSDRICLDRRGLINIPVLDNEPKLRLLSLQHNLVNNLDGFSKQAFPLLVFLDIYDNQLQQITSLDALQNLRVLLLGKNRIRKIEGLENLPKIEVLDLHGNQISQIGGLQTLVDLKVLNLAGNQIRSVGINDLQGLNALQELNLRRNRLKKLHGFGETPNLTKLFVSNNDIQKVEDMSSVAKCPNIKEISIDNNPVCMSGDCASFLVSYLCQLVKLNTMQINEQVRKAAMAWRRNKEMTNTSFMDLTSDVTLNHKREEVISNARTNWELLRSQTKCLTNNISAVNKSLKNLKPDSDFFLTSLQKSNLKNNMPARFKLQTAGSSNKVPVLPDKKNRFIRSSSQDTENSQNTSSSNTSGGYDYFKLPPILVPITNKTEKHEDNHVKLSDSLSSIGPNIDSSVSSLGSLNASSSSSTASSCTEQSDSESEDIEIDEIPEKLSELNEAQGPEAISSEQIQLNVQKSPSPKVIDIGEGQLGKCTPESASIVSATTSNVTVASSTSSSDNSRNSKPIRSIKSALNGRSINIKQNARAFTAKVKKQVSPAAPKDREQGGDYLIEISGRNLNIYGQGALRFIDKPWNISKANDVTTVKFNYVNFNSVTSILSKIKHRFPNVANLVFKETNISFLGQLNALAEVQGIQSLYIDDEGNPITQKHWQDYAIYRLSHWGLKIVNDKQVTEEDIKRVNEDYESLNDTILWSLPDELLQPLLIRLRIDVDQEITEQNAKKWLMNANPALRNVVSKEALQWRKGPVTQEDHLLRQKAKQYISGLFDETHNAMNKLRLLEQQWPTILHEYVRNTLLDYSHLDMYMKQKIQELINTMNK